VPPEGLALSLKREDGVLLATYQQIDGRPPIEERLHLVLKGEYDLERMAAEDQYVEVEWSLGGEQYDGTPRPLHRFSAATVSKAAELRRAEISAKFWGEVFKPQIGPGATSSASPEEERALQEALRLSRP
jgi:hypothetical protein